MEIKKIIVDSLEKAISYPEFKALLIRLQQEGKVTGETQSEAMLEYSKMNLQRMKRIEKTYSPSEAFSQWFSEQSQAMIWLVLTEGWCGDAAQNLPILDQIANLNPKVVLKLVLRDENPELMDQFLTNGGKSIPKLIALEPETLTVLGSWGPRPETVQNMVLEHKENPQEEYAEFTKKIHLWYAKDKGRSLEKEIKDHYQNWLRAQ